MLFLVIRAGSSDLFTGLTTAIVTILVLFVILVGIGFALIVRRRRRDPNLDATPIAAPVGSVEDIAELATRANIALVRLDDAVNENEDELGFAIAQFGDERSQSFGEAIAAARTALAEAFRLKQQLDDAEPDSSTQRREWNQRILHLCESSQSSLADEAAAFDALRRADSDAPAELKAVRMLIVSLTMRVPASEATLSRLGSSYSSTVVDTVRSNLSDARELLKTAAQRAGDADTQLSDPGATGAAEVVQDARSSAQRAARLLDAVDNLGVSLAAQTSRLAELVAKSKADLAEGRIARDSVRDPDSSGAIGSAIAALESVLTGFDEADPAASIARIDAATAGLDAALASARNQSQRLEHAQAALAGVLVGARSQIAATKDFIEGRPGSVGADARTRLAEAQRLLVVAEAQADPVAALDTARSSATYSRDADALARYDLLRE